MNGVATFRLCKLSNDDLIKKVDSGTDEMFKTGKIPKQQDKPDCCGGYSSEDGCCPFGHESNQNECIEQ